jgi:hypothetical protein
MDGNVIDHGWFLHQQATAVRKRTSSKANCTCVWKSLLFLNQKQETCGKRVGHSMKTYLRSSSSYHSRSFHNWATVHKSCVASSGTGRAIKGTTKR